ncbi:MAG: AAA family ATPase [Prevotella sp.]|nr:AAA family ATPase [Prevotella sp.]
MTPSEFISLIKKDLNYQPTPEQEHVLTVFSQFLADRNPHSVMVLRGSAGTGKTTLAAAMVSTLHRLGQKLTLMAPTGRAAKVFSLHSNLTAYTIHRRIYREKNYTGIGGIFNLNDNRYHRMLFVVDEASMIGSRPAAGDITFGTASLLDDLIQYVYSGDGCRLLLIGDNAQLPPVGETEAPALNTVVLEGYGLKVWECSLASVLRQSQFSGILYNATQIRTLIDEPVLPRIRLWSFTDVQRIPGDELIESLATSYSEAGIDDTIVLTRSNKRANVYNQGIRASVLDREEALCTSDMVMTVKNNYFYTLSTQQDGKDGGAFLANGDRAKILRVRHFRSFYGFQFADVCLQFPDYDEAEIEATVIMDTLTSEAPALTREQNEQLWQNVMDDYQDLSLKTDRLKAMKADRYYNALQIKFAYAVTCHKAQGGQWQHVYIDQGYMTDDMLTPEYMHWLYTAFTRATRKVFLVNWPEKQIEPESAPPEDL